jgi:hypothetical protein
MAEKYPTDDFDGPSLFSHWAEDLEKRDKEASDSFCMPLIGSQMREEADLEQRQQYEDYHLSGGLIGHHLIEDDEY